MVLKLFANAFWLYTPGYFQKKVSYLFSNLFKHKFTKAFIAPYCLFFGLENDYLEQFESETGKSSYYSYSDFFNRRYRTAPKIEAEVVWPCEGYLCDWGAFSEKNNSVVKGQRVDLNSIFASDKKVTKDYQFLNIFLHNHNYHRVHSPLSGRITKMTSIPGNLVFLRPWFYKRKDVSYPAFRNERLVFEIVDSNNKPWYVALVGGFGVGTIETSPEISVNSQISVGQELAKFNLGSTVCIAGPFEKREAKYLQVVRVGESMEIHT
jgi:phosphatidylserine decarboxylase